MKRRSEKFRGTRKRLSSSKSSWVRSRCRLAESKKESAMQTKFLVRAFLIVGLAHFTVLPGMLFSQSDFFKGKTITIIQGRDPGGTGDMRVRAMIPFLQKYIPGNPSIVSEYMRSEERRVGKECRSVR